MICLLLSAKFLEMTYPGVAKLNQLIQSPFFYEDYISLERHTLETLNWQLHMVTPHDILALFLAQGIVFTSDSIISFREAR